MEHIAIIQRAQAIAATDHRELLRVSAELAVARAELKRLRRKAQRRADRSAVAGASGAGVGQDDGPVKREFIAFRAKSLAALAGERNTKRQVLDAMRRKYEGLRAA